MKEITAYFSSPTKKNKTKVEVGSSNPGSSKKSETLENIGVTSTSRQSACTSCLTPEESPKKKRKRRKANRLHKLSDPAVKTVTELFSNSLCLLSPDKQSNVKAINPKQTKFEDEENAKYTKIASPKRGEADYNHVKNAVVNVAQTSKKTNAFEFMMDSRNKSIGTNSPGKELSEKKTEDILERDKLIVRKNLLSSWAEQKGASKRKRAEEELDEVINYKLDKRAKRLRKLLKADKVTKKVNGLTKVIVKNTRKKMARISCSSNSGESDNEFEKINVRKCKIGSNSRKDGMLKEIKIEDNCKASEITKELKKKECKTEKTRLKVNPKKQDSKILEKNKQKILCKEKVTATRSAKSVGTVDHSLSIASKRSSKNIDTSSQTNEIDLKQKSLFNKNSQKIVCKADSVTSDIKTEIKCDEIIRVEHCNKKKSNKTKRKLEKEVDGSSQDSFTQKSQCWKMRIKISSVDGMEVSNKEENRELRKHDDVSSVDENSDDKIEDALTLISSESEDDSNVEKKSIKNAKIAPVFIKAIPKPKEDSKVREARRQFLMSGIPSSLKKVVEKQQSIEEQKYNVFPTISHVQQKCDNTFWNLPDPVLNVKESKPLEIDQSNLMCKGITKSHIPQKLNIKVEVEKIDKLKLLLNKIKSDNPNYPVYKSFRSIYDKSGKILSNKSEMKMSPKKNKKSKRKKLNSSCEITQPPVVPSDPDCIEHSMWTEKYKPKCSDDIIGNYEAINKLKKWLVTWMKYSEEINSKKKRRGSSESDFDTTDCESRDSTILPGNTIVLGGPCGSGKSTAVYAICRELGFNVIELNASSKRTGKRLLQEIQEATQSHQVRKKKSQFFVNNHSKENIEGTECQINKRMCVLLIEDIDIVFEQDDGFISALTQLIITSKRPIILTTSDYDSVFVQKFLGEYEYIPFLSLSSYSLATWLQIVCLIEGIFVQQADVGSLLEFNKGDVRKTLLQLQFWVSSGGQLFQSDTPIKLGDKRTSCEEKLVDDEEPNCSITETTNKEIDTTIHRHSIGSFEIFHFQKQFTIPYYFNLGMIWWNIPNIINLPSLSCQRILKFRQEPQCENIKTIAEKCKSTPEDKIKLNLANKLYDALTFTDIIFKKVNYFDTDEPVLKNVNCRIGTSLELVEDLNAFSGDADFVHEITHELVDGHIKEYNDIDGGRPKIDMAVPNNAERRWRAKNHACAEIFQGALCVSNHLERKSVALDYMPVLRNIYRSESIRASYNKKRGNRFRNYLKDLGINCYGSTVKLACNIMKETD